jgi:hypothetical protein
VRGCVQGKRPDLQVSEVQEVVPAGEVNQLTGPGLVGFPHRCKTRGHALRGPTSSVAPVVGRFRVAHVSEIHSRVPGRQAGDVVLHLTRDLPTPIGKHSEVSDLLEALALIPP